jgi:hypothetical protein
MVIGLFGSTKSIFIRLSVYFVDNDRTCDAGDNCYVIASIYHIHHI